MVRHVEGESVARYLRRTQQIGPASRLGVQRKIGDRWEDISLSYRLKRDDKIRVKGAEGKSSPAQGLKDLARRIVLRQKSR